MVEHLNYYGRIYLFFWEILIWAWIGMATTNIHTYDTAIGIAFICWPNMHVVVCDLMEL